MSKWIEFISDRPDAKTKRWIVVAKEGGVSLGMIRWYGPWRQYTFQPNANTIFERQCLRDLAEFCDTETAAHFRLTRLAKAAAKTMTPVLRRMNSAICPKCKAEHDVETVVQSGGRLRCSCRANIVLQSADDETPQGTVIDYWFRMEEVP